MRINTRNLNEAAINGQKIEDVEGFDYPGEKNRPNMEGLTTTSKAAKEKLQQYLKNLPRSPEVAK